MYKKTDRTTIRDIQLCMLKLMTSSTCMLLLMAYTAVLHAEQPQTIDSRRSLAVTEQSVLTRFAFERVMNQLVAQSGVPGLTSLDLFRQWWDTQNPRPSLGLGPHCDDEVSSNGETILNGFPYTCRTGPAEGIQATSGDPFTDPATNPDAYLPIGLFNRFDLARADGAHCGEYRIVYAKRSGITNGLERNLLIFEAALPNPHLKQGLDGCRTIVEFWSKLSETDDINERADALERFYFRGLGNVEPVIHVSHYGDNVNQAGQIRTNQFMQPDSPRAWSLREFKLLRTCDGGVCSGMRFIPVTAKVNPFGALHDTNSAHSQAPGYQEHFLGQVAGLAANTLNTILFNVPDKYNSAQSQASGSDEANYVAQAHFTPAESPDLDPSCEGNLTFQCKVKEKLAQIGSTLKPEHIIKRALSQSCAGCHQLLNGEGDNGTDIGENLVWPPSLRFTHVTERQTEVVDGQERFRISAAMLEVFLPQRRQIMGDYLNNKLKKPKDPRATLSGRKTH
jgi:hypothetical protein